jgi:hypothetical protein
MTPMSASDALTSGAPLEADCDGEQLSMGSTIVASWRPDRHDWKTSSNGIPIGSWTRRSAISYIQCLAKVVGTTSQRLEKGSTQVLRGLRDVDGYFRFE